MNTLPRRRSPCVGSTVPKAVLVSRPVDRITAAASSRNKAGPGSCRPSARCNAGLG